MKKIIWAAIVACLFFVATTVRAEDEKFEITGFDVRGNSLLPKDEVASLVAPFTGKDRVYGDVQRALEALEAAYRARGFGTVTVYVPEQELKGGVVVLQVTEAVIGKVSVTGNRSFSAENVRAALPQLKEGTAPNLSAISDNVQLSNENPAKHVELTLGVSEEAGKVDAKVGVSDENPRRVYFSLDNTGDKEKTGQYRLGVSYRDANVFGHDEVMTLGYIMAPDAPGGVDVNVFTAGLRIPFYKLGDSLDLIVATSSVNVPANVITPGGGPLSLSGKGYVLAARWNNLFPRQGEYNSRMVYGFDYKWTDNPCRPKIVGAGCVDYLATPLSATYIGQWQKPNLAADFSLGAAYNATPLDHQERWRYNYAANARSTDANFLILKGGGSYLRSLPGDWQVRGVLSAQYSSDPLPSSEQLSLAGSTAVRGFSERVLTADSGLVANLEAYTPDLVPLLDTKTGLPGTLRALVFYDWAYGDSNSAGGWTAPAGICNTPCLATPSVTTMVSSVGLGLRYLLQKDISAKFDWARILNSAPNPAALTQRIDDLWRMHFALVYGF
ncbi:Hemolysin activation/secretion protein [Georgfuchsia toluolica]|uniref:Hemolysin activation/secretion protein n=1 Tax=Georgfuchsia toluolica TaxID=424218 RepID=A0A916J552_9PROT|nr:ShlB/FhaC/HecB family hemolysin secretion/activation protein [Georgfuchsia toluolica]CAG4884871.1 Hemolysin activation/secretion protein [Georgfuchsia toluolica]